MRKVKYKNFIVLVDSHRRPSRCRNTWGRYRVGAKNEEEAKRLVQKAIGFGSVLVYYEAKDLLAGYRQVFLERWTPEVKENYGFALVPPHHANAPRPKKNRKND